MTHPLLDLESPPRFKLVDLNYIACINYRSRSELLGLGGLTNLMDYYNLKLTAMFEYGDCIILYGSASNGIYVYTDNLHIEVSDLLIENYSHLNHDQFVKLYNQYEIHSQEAFIFVKFKTEEQIILANTLNIF